MSSTKYYDNQPFCVLLYCGPPDKVNIVWWDADLFYQTAQMYTIYLILVHRTIFSAYNIWTKSLPVSISLLCYAEEKQHKTTTR